MVVIVVSFLLFSLAYTSKYIATRLQCKVGLLMM
nr:MAG TPA: hypothetical protein [Caudoviricetes sp.]